ncbi:MAG TPA: NADP-dependent oxidoreductase [Gemmatimonadaceae bacterium]|nr:NADP-dependent oxidoreductase [Gemmatimonadaceae bacterium]
MPTSREIRLAARPRGMPTAETFELATVDVGSPGDGQVLVRNRIMSVDPYMRGRMNDVKSYVPPFQVGAPLEGDCIGEVVESRAENFAAGDVVQSFFGWREFHVSDAKLLRKVDPSVEPRSAWLGVLGVTGFTAWAGLRLVDVKTGDRVFVSGAAGGVGIIVGQLAKLRGCTVIGSAGSADKVRMLTGELGFDAAFNYRDGDVYRQLMSAAPQGIDVYFDNVGGDHLEAAISALRPFGRVVACGSISGYNEPTPGPRNMAMIIGKRLTIRGFIVSDHEPRRAEFQEEVSALLARGALQARETAMHGIENAPAAFLGLFSGSNTGKMIVTLD